MNELALGWGPKNDVEAGSIECFNENRLEVDESAAKEPGGIDTDGNRIAEGLKLGSTKGIAVGSEEGDAFDGASVGSLK